MDKELTLTGHLEELRRRIIISLAAIIAASVFAFPLAPKALIILKSPSNGMIGRLAFFTPAEAFLVHIKIAFFTGLVLSMPVVLYQLWMFISPAIGAKARRRGAIFTVSSFGAFASGAAFGYFILLPTALKFLLGFCTESLTPVISISGYISFVMGLVLGSGLVFEMPVLSYLLTKIGVINHRYLRRMWKYAIIVIFITAAIVTPTPDVFNMTMLAIPMLILYEISIWVSWVSGGRRAALICK